MSESEIRKILERACSELDRYSKQARKAILPGALGASLALTGCAGTAKNEPDKPPIGDPVETVAVADAGVTAVEAVEAVAPADAGLAAVESPPAPADAAVPSVKERPPYYDIPKPYMAPDAVPLYQTLDKTRVG